MATVDIVTWRGDLRYRSVVKAIMSKFALRVAVFAYVTGRGDAIRIRTVDALAIGDVGGRHAARAVLFQALKVGQLALLEVNANHIAQFDKQLGQVLIPLGEQNALARSGEFVQFVKRVESNGKHVNAIL